MSILLEQLDKISNASGDHDGHIARVVSKAIRRAKLGEISQGSAKYIIKDLLQRYNHDLFPNSQLVKALASSALDKDLMSV